MAIAKVVYKENASATPEVWMDTTQKTVTAGTMLSGTTALKNDGTGITGNIASKSSSDLTASGATVTAPAGYYPNAASKTVASGSASTPATSITANPTISVNASGLITASVSGSKSVTPTVSDGYVSAGTAGTVSVSGSNTQQLSTQASATIPPSTTSQTAVAAGKYTTGAVTVAAMPSGTAGTPTATKGTVSNHSISVTPSVTNATGYITGSTINGTAVTVDVTELESGAKTITENGTGISVSGYSTVDVNVASAQKGAKLWVDVQDGETVSLNIHGNTPVADWGDGESGGTSHTYKYGGLKVITVVGSEFGAYALGQSSSSHNMNLLAVEYFAESTSFSSIFAYCDKLESLSITADAGALRSSDTQMFANNANLKYLHLADGMPVISTTMFYRCPSLTTVTIPSTITTIGSNAFGACTSLSVVHVLPTVPPSLGSAYVFNNNAANRIIYVPYSDDHSIITAYQSATNWSNYASAMQEEPQ